MMHNIMSMFFVKNATKVLQVAVISRIEMAKSYPVRGLVVVDIIMYIYIQLKLIRPPHG